MIDALKQLLQELTSLDGPPGFEQPVVRYLAAAFQETGATVMVDPMGNLYARLGDPTARPHLMLSAHSDEIAGIVRYISPAGFLWIDPLGGLIASALVAQRVRVAGNLGVVGMRPGHLQTPDERLRVPPVQELFIDVGASSAAEVAAMNIRVGSPVTYLTTLASFTNSSRVTGKAIDNRLGCAVLLLLFRALKRREIGGRLTALIAVQEEVGLRGAKVGAYRVQPDYAIVLDTLPVADTPGVSESRMPGAIGRGPVLVITASSGTSGLGHIAHPRVQAWLETAADTAGVAVQFATSIGVAVTDAANIHTSREGIPTGVVGFPRRYSHSPICMFDLNDGVESIRLLQQFVDDMPQHTDFSFL